MGGSRMKESPSRYRRQAATQTPTSPPLPMHLAPLALAPFTSTSRILVSPFSPAPAAWYQDGWRRRCSRMRRRLARLKSVLKTLGQYLQATARLMRSRCTEEAARILLGHFL